MHYLVHLALAADTPEKAKEAAETYLNNYPRETDWYEIIDVIPMTDKTGHMSADAANRIETAIKSKDEKIAETINLFSIPNGADQIIKALDPTEINDPFNCRTTWTEATRTKGKSLATHHNEDDYEKLMVIYTMKKLLALLDSEFHNESGFYDVEELYPSTHELMKRINEDPQRQWLVIADLHN